MWLCRRRIHFYFRVQLAFVLDFLQSLHSLLASCVFIKERVAISLSVLGTNCRQHQNACSLTYRANKSSSLKLCSRRIRCSLAAPSSALIPISGSRMFGGLGGRGGGGPSGNVTGLIGRNGGLGSSSMESSDELEPLSPLELPSSLPPGIS